MLIPYQLKRSAIHNAQSFVNHVMLEVVFNAKKNVAVDFTSALVLPKYKNLIDATNTNYILTPLKEIFSICKHLHHRDIKTLKRAVHHNNKIRELCNGDIEPVRYDEIKKINKNLAKHIKIFCDELYDKCLGIACFYKQFEDIDIYYKFLVGRKTICNCCGVSTILNKYHKHRSALDHYLPKSVYPFVSINFKNLMPICDTCNSKYKLATDTLLITEKRGTKIISETKVKAFYPFSKTKHTIDININFLKKYDRNIEPNDMQITFTNALAQDKVDNWERVFCISDNYKALCCSEDMDSYIEEQYMAEMNNGKSHTDYIGLLEKNKYGDKNFLKIPFLEAVGR